MVLTRHQSRMCDKEKDSQGAVSSCFVQTMTTSTVQSVSSPLFSTTPMHTSYSWTEGISNCPMRNDTAVWQTNTNTGSDMHMRDLQNKVSTLESSLMTVTNELKQAIQTIHSQNHNANNVNASTIPHTNACSTSLRQLHNNDQSDSESEGSLDNVISRSQRLSRPRHRETPKLPPFTGKETWQVWFNRFDDIARRFRWSDDEKLDQILPRLQGAAGDFVYGQLSQATRSNYQSLCAELKSRFRVVETRKTFWMQFSNRMQQEGETVEEYGAELKKLYDKAHTCRDTDTRREDLLRRFLDGLLDDKARFHVEFVKEPHDIDEAIYHSVCFQETKQRHKINEHIRTTSDGSSNENQSQNNNTYARTASGKNKVIKVENENQTTQPSSQIDLEKLREIMREEIQNSQATNHSQSNGYSKYGYSHTMGRNQNPKNWKQNNFRPKRVCYNCGDPSHFKRDCPKPIVEQLEQRTNKPLN